MRASAVGKGAVKAGLKGGKQIGSGVPIDAVDLGQFLLLMDVGLLTQRVVIEEAPAEYHARHWTMNRIDPARGQ